MHLSIPIAIALNLALYATAAPMPVPDNREASQGNTMAPDVASELAEGSLESAKEMMKSMYKDDVDTGNELPASITNMDLTFPNADDKSKNPPPPPGPSKGGAVAPTSTKGAGAGASQETGAATSSTSGEGEEDQEQQEEEEEEGEEQAQAQAQEEEGAEEEEEEATPTSKAWPTTTTGGKKSSGLTTMASPTPSASSVSGAWKEHGRNMAESGIERETAQKPTATEKKAKGTSDAVQTPKSTNISKDNPFSKLPLVGSLLSGGGLL